MVYSMHCECTVLKFNFPGQQIQMLALLTFANCGGLVFGLMYKCKASSFVSICTVKLSRSVSPSLFSIVVFSIGHA